MTLTFADPVRGMILFITHQIRAVRAPLSPGDAPIWIAAALILLSGCSPMGQAEPTNVMYGQQGVIYSPDAVQRLSVASGQELQEEGAFARAVNCAVAVRVTRETLAASTYEIGAEAIAAMRQAETMFEQRARQASPDDADREIAQRRRATVENRGEQVQRAVACLRTVS